MKQLISEALLIFKFSPFLLLLLSISPIRLESIISHMTSTAKIICLSTFVCYFLVRIDENSFVRRYSLFIHGCATVEIVKSCRTTFSSCFGLDPLMKLFHVFWKYMFWAKVLHANKALIFFPLALMNIWHVIQKCIFWVEFFFTNWAHVGFPLMNW